MSRELSRCRCRYREVAVAYDLKYVGDVPLFYGGFFFIWVAACVVVSEVQRSFYREAGGSKCPYVDRRCRCGYGRWVGVPFFRFCMFPPMVGAGDEGTGERCGPGGGLGAGGVRANACVVCRDRIGSRQDRYGLRNVSRVDR